MKTWGRTPGSLLALALCIMGCSETSGTDASGGAGAVGGDGGSSGAAGMGGGGVGGMGGAAGNPIEPCERTADRCMNAAIDPHVACCEQAVPDQPNACDGAESLENPATCAPTGNVVTHRLTVMEIEDDCNVGYDLDDCDGLSCVPSGWLVPDGMSGVDNALAGWGAVLGDIGGNLGSVNQGLADMICGATDDRSAGTCVGGENEGNACTHNDDCPGAGAWCDRNDDDCLLEITPTEIRFVIDANPDEGCANVTVLTDGEASAHILNLSDDGCASGTLGTIPLHLAGNDGNLANAFVRMTVSSAGFSHGQLGAAIDANLAVSVNELYPIRDLPIVFDINASTPPIRDASAACSGLSATLRIGGVAE